MKRTGDCPSSWALERHLLGEPSGAADHIAACPTCQADIAARRAAGDEYMRSTDAARIQQLLAERERGERPSARRAVRLALRWWLAPVAAAAAIALVWALVHRDADPADSLAAHSGASEEQEVLLLEREWCAANLHNDAAELDRILANGYTLTDSRGHVRTKADDLEAARTGAIRYSIFENRDMKVRIYGDTAIVTGRTRLKGVTRQGRTIDTEVMFTDTLARIDGRWRAVAGHLSRAGGG